MATLVTPLSDGGRVEVDWAAGGDMHVRKYDAGGAAVGEEFVTTPLYNQEPKVLALADGGFVIGTGFAMKGGTYVGYVFDGQARFLTSIDFEGSGLGYQIAASPDGGFLVASMAQHLPPGGGPADLTYQPFLALYDNRGQVVEGPAGIAGDLPSIGVDSAGHYQVAWNDGGIARTLEIDPESPPDLTPPAAPAFTLLDDQGAHTGEIDGYSTDATPVIRVAVSEVGTVLLNWYVGGYPDERSLDGGVAVTEADVARGYIDLSPPDFVGDMMSMSFFVRFKDAEGVVSDRTEDHLTYVLRPEIWSVSDDAGPQTGELTPGATTDDATPTVTIGLESSGLEEGDTLYLRDGSTVVGQTLLTAEDVSRGYATVTSVALENGEHALQAHMGGPLPAFNLTVAAAEASPTAATGQEYFSDRYGDSIQGGAGADTIHAGQGPDMLSGAGGGDVFVFEQVPWNAGHVTDFEVGVDRLDLSALIASSGYAGSDPQADGYIRLEASGGSTNVFFDPDGPASGNPWPLRIVTLDGVSANGLNWSQLADPAGPQPDPGTDHTPAITGLGGGALPMFRVWESGLVDGSSPDPTRVNVDASIVLDAEDGVKDLYIGSQLIISDGAFSPTSYTDTGLPFTIIFRSFDAATGQLDVTYRLNDAMDAPVGPDGVHTGWGLSLFDRDGDNARASFEVVIHDDAAAPVNDADVIASNATTAVTGNILTDASPGDAGDGDNGADRMGADGAVLYGMLAPGIGGFSGAFGPSASLTGRYGTITLQANGDYSYVLDGAAPAGSTETFVYTLRDGDGDDTTATLQINIVAPEDVPDPGSTQGATLTSSRYGDTLVAGPGDDTLVAGRGPDVLTGGGGDDVFRYVDTPWNAGHVTDFQAGDVLDLSALFQASGYAGEDPVADGYLRFENDGQGYAQVFYDTDGPAAGSTVWWKIATLDHVSANGLSWAQLSGAGEAGPPPGGPGEVVTSDRYGDTLTGTAGDDTLVAGQGPDRMTGEAGADRYVWNDLPWNAGHVTDFTPGADQLDLRPLFQAWGYSGSDPLADHRLEFRDDGAGSTQVYFDRDEAGAGDWPYLIATLDSVAPSQLHPSDWIF